jgi:hypothetical protein
MRTFRNSKGPFAERPHFTAAEIERTCLDELRAVDLLPSQPSPVRIERFIERRFHLRPIYDDLPTGILGFTRFGHNGAEEMKIARALAEDGTATAERRITTTLGHEGGHCLLHAYLFAVGNSARSLFGDPDALDSPVILCRDEVSVGNSASERRYDGRWWEYQANQAMAALLLPRPLVEKCLKPFMVAAGGLGTTTLDDGRREEATRTVAEIFEVNRIVARLRIAGLCGSDGQQLSL